MNENDKGAFVTALVSHFPYANDEDGRLCWRECIGYDLTIVKQAIEKHRLEEDSSAFRPGPMRLATLCREIQNPVREHPALKRTNEALQIEREHEKKIDAEWLGIDTVIDCLSDEEIAALKSTVMDDPSLIPEGFAARVKDKDPRTNRTLKAAIFRHLQKQRLAVA